MVEDVISPEVRAAIQRNEQQAQQLRTEARQRLGASYQARRAAAEDAALDARLALQRAQQPLRVSGDARERGLQRLEHDEALAMAQQRHSEAIAALQRLDHEERESLGQLLREAERAQHQANAAVQQRVGGAWDVQQANALLATDPTVAPLLAAQRAAGERVAAITQAVQTLYGER